VEGINSPETRGVAAAFSRRTAYVFPSGPPHRGFVHFPLQRRDVGKGAEQVGVVQAVAHRFLTSDPPQMAE